VRGWRWRFAGLAVLFVLLGGGCSSGSATARQVHLDAGPAAASFDTPVHITVSGLSPAGLVTLQAMTRDFQGRWWESAADFRASAAGTLNLAAAVPVSGSYHVADAAGLLWSLHPAFTKNPEVQFIMGNGFTVRLQVLAGGQVKATATLARLWSIRTVPSVQTVSRDGIASTLFTPDKITPGAPAVVVIGGSQGGEDTLTAAALAMAGYPALALGYFKEPGLPQCLCAIPLEYFARAVHWLRAQPVARGRRVVLIGGSRGAEAALLVASYEPHLFDAVVADSPSAYVNGAFGGTGAAWTFHGKPLTTGAAIPVGNIRVPVLLSDGGRDSVWLSAASASTIMQELRGSGDRAPYANLYYPDAGHAYAGLPPYLSYSGYAFNGQYVYLGGSEQANARAAEQFWPKMIEFINNPSAPLN
jgi:dienelactone hydrolase